MITLLILVLFALLILMIVGLIALIGPIILIPILLVCADVIFLRKLFGRKNR